MLRAVACTRGAGVTMIVEFFVAAGDVTVTRPADIVESVGVDHRRIGGFVIDIAHRCLIGCRYTIVDGGVVAGRLYGAGVICGRVDDPGGHGCRRSWIWRVVLLVGEQEPGVSAVGRGFDGNSCVIVESGERSVGIGVEELLQVRGRRGCARRPFLLGDRDVGVLGCG